MKLNASNVRYYCFLLICCVCLLCDCRAEGNNTNGLFTEVSGHSRSLLSINYERLFQTSVKNVLFSTRTGIGFTPGAGNRDSNTYRSPGVTVPIVFSIIAGKKYHFGQLGFSYTACFGETFTETKSNKPVSYQNYESAYILSIGYRFVDISGVTAQLFPTAVWTNNPSKKFGFLLGLCLGYTW